MNDMGGTAQPDLIGFGPFVLDCAAKQLRRDGGPVKLGSRAFDLLVMLVTHAGRVVSRDALVEVVWPRTLVEETSLRVHISALRRVLGGGGEDGPRFIANVPGLGYSFVMPVHTLAAPLAAGAAPPMPPGPARTFGRADVVKLIGEQLAHKRLLSIVGPGGMGKTTVALAVAEAGAPNYPDGVRFVDLSSLSDPAKVPAALAFAVGAIASQSEPMRALEGFLRARRMLIVLDNCEHVIHAAAELAEAVLAAAPGIRIVATSREPLDVNGEWVHRLAPLAAPEPASGANAAQALAFPAVQLLVERACAADGFHLDDANVGLVLQLCRRLDGIALAIELAAARIEGLGLEALVARLNEMFELLARGRRTALPRHRTLLALFDWSYALLDAPERHVLACMSVFRTRFTLDAVVAVAGGGDAALAPDDIVDCVLRLAAKSLVAVDAGTSCTYRLLYTTRTYAAERLREGAAAAFVARCHADYLLGVFERRPHEPSLTCDGSWQARHRYLMDDVRAAIDWALGIDGDLVLGVQLVVTAYESMYGLGSLDADREQIELAIEKIVALDPPQHALELRARSAWVFLSGQTALDDGGREFRRNSATVLDAAAGASPQQLIFALHGVCCGNFGHGDYPLSLDAARQIRVHAGPDAPASVLLSDRLVAQNLHFLGRHHEARALALKVMLHPDVAMPREFASHAPKSVSLRGLLALISWIEGDFEGAVRLAAEAVALAQSETLITYVACQALAMAAIPVALWCGEIERAATLNSQLAVLAFDGGLRYWETWATGFAHAIELARGEACSDGWRAPDNAKERDMLATLDTTLACAATVARCEAGTVGWCAPEVLRALGEQVLSAGGAGAVARAAALFERAIALAQSQHALGWELRAAISRARLWQTAGRRDAAVALLAPLLERLAGGRVTSDVRHASALIAQCSTELLQAQ